MSWKIEETEIEAIASNTFPQQAVVSVISVVCFSGPPVSGRYDEGDYLDVWAAVDESLHAQSVVLYGCGTLSQDPNCPNWRDIVNWQDANRCKSVADQLACIAFQVHLLTSLLFDQQTRAGKHIMTTMAVLALTIVFDVTKGFS
jgi:hypothetical protein